MKKFVLFLILLLFLQAGAFAQNSNAIKPKPTRPKIGLVFSGGGAKGFAFIGLLKVF